MTVQAIQVKRDINIKMIVNISFKTTPLAEISVRVSQSRRSFFSN